MKLAAFETQPLGGGIDLGGGGVLTFSAISDS